MKKAIIRFEHKGKQFTRRALFTFPNLFLSENENNQCTSIDEDYVENGHWALLFEEKDYTYRAQFKFDFDKYECTLEPECMVITRNDGEEFDIEVPFTANITNTRIYK